MRDRDLYQHLMGLVDPWKVARVELDVAGHRVDVFAEHVLVTSWPCPQCGTLSPLYDHEPERTWRHLDSC